MEFEVGVSLYTNLKLMEACKLVLDFEMMETEAGRSIIQCLIRRIERFLNSPIQFVIPGASN